MARQVLRWGAFRDRHSRRPCPSVHPWCWFVCRLGLRGLVVFDSSAECAFMMFAEEHETSKNDNNTNNNADSGWLGVVFAAFCFQNQGKSSSQATPRKTQTLNPRASKPYVNPDSSTRDDYANSFAARRLENSAFRS